jgi:hypothetical protein
MLAPAFEQLLASLQARQERGTLWVPTLAMLADRLRAMADLTLTLVDDHHLIAHTDRPIVGATFLVQVPNADVRVADALPRGRRDEAGTTIFWADLAPGDTRISY